MDFKIERVALALKSLGDPHRQFAAIHVAGTNGKGSVAAMLHAICCAAGYRVGLYTSPHLVSFTERIRVGTETISQQDVVALARDIHSAATVRGIDLTFFEFVTVMAFLHFARCGIDLAVVEVGLGGRLDATNVLDPEVAVITSIGLDHQEFLGDTLGSVAYEKAGIIKAGRPVVVGNVPPEAQSVLDNLAATRGAPLYRAGRDFNASRGTTFRFSGMGHELSDVRTALRGSFQRDNAATAIATILRLPHRFPIGIEAIRRGLESVRWPGRLDVVANTPLVFLDGAHNLDGIRALVAELPAIVERRPLHLLFGVMRDKQWQPMVDAIAPLASTVTVTTVLPPRGEAAETLASAFARYCPVRAVPEPRAALESLLASVPDTESILATGSLFLVGALYPYFLQRQPKHPLFDHGSAALLP
ncbi:MAG: folylpolyglutamate synthase/dihydrofolate synthase family protein [Candidatus Binatia bacterium]